MFTLIRSVANKEKLALVNRKTRTNSLAACLLSVECTRFEFRLVTLVPCDWK